MPKMGSILQKFSLKKSDFPILSHLSDDTMVEQKTFEVKQTIFDTQKQMWPAKGVGVFLVGGAEIYQEIELYEKDTNYYSMRPFRILSPKDVIGDFTAIERVLNPEALNIIRPGEEFKLKVGKRSVLLLGGDFLAGGKWSSTFHTKEEIGPNNIGHIQGFNPEYLANSLFKKEKVEMIFIEEDEFLKNSNSWVSLLEASWNNSRLYRQGLNSYNIQKTLKFRKKFQESVALIKETRAINLKRKGKKGKEAIPKMPNGKYLATFPDIISDALNKPLRREPGFAKYSGWNDEQKLMLKKCGLGSDHILVARPWDNKEINEFYVPIDYRNHILSYLIKEDSKLSVTDLSTSQKLSDISTNNATQFLIEAINFSLQVENSDSNFPWIVQAKEFYLPAQLNQICLIFQRK